MNYSQVSPCRLRVSRRRHHDRVRPDQGFIYSPYQCLRVPEYLIACATSLVHLQQTDRRQLSFISSLALRLQVLVLADGVRLKRLPEHLTDLSRRWLYACCLLSPVDLLGYLAFFSRFSWTV